MARKEPTAQIKLLVKAGEANPSPPVGPALGQHGLNIMEFCKAFNDRSQTTEKGMPLPVVITVYADKSFVFIIKTPPVSTLLKKAANVEKGSGEPNSRIIGRVSKAQVEKIAKIKMVDLTAANLDAAIRTIEGTAKNMGIDIQ